MTDLNTIVGYPIALGDDGQLYYVAYSVQGQPYGWRVSYIDHLRHHHAHHHASHHPKHHGVVALSHRRTVQPKLHHAANAQPAMASSNGSHTLHTAGKVAAPAPKGESGPAGTLEAFEKRHMRLILGLQGGLDLAAGPATVATTVTIALALAPETGGLSLLLAAGAIVYGITRGSIQTAAGATELITAATGNKEEVESVKEGMEQVKTLTSVSGFLILTTQQVRYGKVTKNDWTHAGYASDAETLITGRGIDRAFEEASETVRISSKVATALKWGGRADKTDQIHADSKDALSAAHWAASYIEQQNRDRKRKLQQQSPGLPSTPQKGGN
jgi:hypothetical protein